MTVFPQRPFFILYKKVQVKLADIDFSMSAKVGYEDKLLVMSNFSFSHSVFYLFEELSAIFIKFENVCKLFRFGSLKFVVWGRVKPFTYCYTTCSFKCRCSSLKSLPEDILFFTLENFHGKGKSASNQHFLLFPQCFCLIREF